MPLVPGDHGCLSVDGLAALLLQLRQDGRTVLGPTVRDGAVMVGEIATLDDLAGGWKDLQQAGRYRLQRRDDGALFGHAVGPGSFKSYFFPPRLILLRARREDGSFTVLSPPAETHHVALLGVRSCDLHAIAIQDRVFASDAFVDPTYAARRRDVLVVAVNCGAPGGTCFCTSMGTGPRATAGFDLALTEILEGGHRFVVEVGTPAGAALLEALPESAASNPAGPADLQAAMRVQQGAIGKMGRTLDTKGIKELLYSNLEHPRWDDVAGRCLSCTSCTMVCPTCFCSTVEDTTDLTGDTAERTRRWDSCFTSGHSHVHGGPVHATIRSRYRQWLTHKLATWIDQFGTSGCVGCGRCITWCPPGIDLTEEVAAIRATSTTG
jgi:ferredoxin